MDEHELSFFHLEKEDFNLKLKKGVDADAIMAAMPMQQMAAPVAAAPVASAGAPAVDAGPLIDGKAIDSPMVGTFYTKPNPETPAFVKIGDRVNAETTVCIIEAMKVFNEIPAGCTGTVVAVLTDNEEPVEFGKQLFKIDPTG